MEQANIKGFNQSAMQYGTYLGIMWGIMYILLFNSLNSLLLSTAAMALFFSSPFIARKFAVKYRREECLNTITYSQAWKFLFIMYVCATLLSAMTNYIYMNLIDQGSFLTQMNSILAEAANAKDIEAEAKLQINSLIDTLSKMTAGNMTWELLSNNIFSTAVLPPIIALFVRKNK